VAFLIGLALSFMFLEWPWRGIVLIPLAALEVAEWFLFFKLRKVRSISGAEAMVGERGVAITHCRPTGQVRVKGQIWKGRCPEGVSAGTEIVVTGVVGIELDVVPLDREAQKT
jgi:membrane-bound serine protease (ClpP class)